VLKNCHFLTPKKKGRGNFGLSFFSLNSSVIRQFFGYFTEKFANFFDTFMAKPFLNQVGTIPLPQQEDFLLEFLKKNL